MITVSRRYANWAEYREPWMTLHALFKMKRTRYHGIQMVDGEYVDILLGCYGPNK